MSPVGVITGSGTTIVQADDAFLHAVGYTRRDFETGGMNWAAMTPPEFLHLDEAGIRQAITSGSGFTAPYQKEFVRKDGSRVPVLLVCAFVPESVGTWIGYVVDLSAQPPRQASASDADLSLAGRLPEDFYGRLVAELVRERGRMIAMLDNTDALVWAVDPEGKLLAANAAFQAAQRLASGRDLSVGESLLSPDYPPERVAHWKGLYERALAGERLSTRSRLAYQDSVRHYEGVLSPIIDARQGAPVGVAVVSQDVTARVTAEDALRASEARFRELANASPLGIFVADNDGACTYANPAIARTWGLTQEELLGSGWHQHVHPEDAERVLRDWNDATSSAREVVLEYRLTVPALGVRHVRVWAAPIRNGDAVTGYVGSVEDATERNEQTSRARQRDKMESLGTLAGGIAHDFNNMLSVILGFAELALEEDDPSELRSSLREIQVAGTRARELVRQILTFSRQTERADEPVDLSGVVREGARLLRATLSSATEIDVQVPKAPVIVRGDATALQQIVMNLCTNAAHAMRDYVGAIRMHLVTRGVAPNTEALLTVSDSGCGMSPAVLNRVFEPFFTTKPVGAGTGMGLAVVHGIVTAHGGTIAVESSPGTGTTFRVTLPRLSEGAVVELPVPVATTTKGSGHVLIVEDEAPIARFVARALARAGYTTASATNGMEGLRLFSEAPDSFDMVVTDVAMPGLSGDKLAKALRVVRPGQRVLLISGHFGELSATIASETGVNAMLAKPFTQEELVDAVRKTLARER